MKRTHPLPTRRKPPRKPSKRSAPHQLSKAGARGLKESLEKNSPKAAPYYHIPDRRPVRSADIAMFVLAVVLVFLCLWSLSSIHRLGYEAGRGEGWAEGYAAGIEAADVPQP